MLRIHRAGKGPGGLGVGAHGNRRSLGSVSGLGGQGTLPGSPVGLWAKWAGQMPSTPLLLLQSWRVLLSAFSVFPWPPSYAPRTSAAQRGPLRV